MKTIIKITAAISCAVLFVALIANPVSAQNADNAKKAPTSLPADVSKVVMNSCAHCHMEPGNSMALSHVNLSKWDSYEADKKASKAASMSKMISKGKMPPNGFKKDNPDKVPTEADIKVIADWAKSMQPATK
jgi:hypothetical protein